MNHSTPSEKPIVVPTLQTCIQIEYLYSSPIELSRHVLALSLASAATLRQMSRSC